MNPIKTPLEMLFEQAGIPHMALGGDVAKQFAARVAKAISEYKRIHGVAPSAQEVEALNKHVNMLQYPTSGLRTGMSAGPRASYELATDPNLINPDTARDLFLTKMATDRTVKGTKLRPQTQDITNPQVMENIEGRQLSGKLADDMTNVESITPTADYLARQSTGIENEILGGGVLDSLKEGFAQKFGHYPNEDELNAIVAQFNPARHQYGEKGIGIMSERPPTARGMEDWRNAARTEGVEESYLTKRAGNYPKYIRDELAIQRGEVPLSAIKKPKKQRALQVEPTESYMEGDVPVNVYPTLKAEGGHITPNEMMHHLIAQGYEPQKLAAGGRPTLQELDAWTAAQVDPYDMKPKFQAYEPSFREAAADKIAPYLEKIGMTPARAYEQASTIVGHDMGTNPAYLSPTMVFDPVAPFQAVEELAQGKPVSAGLSLAAFAPIKTGSKILKAIKKTK